MVHNLARIRCSREEIIEALVRIHAVVRPCGQRARRYSLVKSQFTYFGNCSSAGNSPARLSVPCNQTYLRACPSLNEFERFEKRFRTGHADSNAESDSGRRTGSRDQPPAPKASASRSERQGSKQSSNCASTRGSKSSLPSGFLSIPLSRRSGVQAFGAQFQEDLQPQSRPRRPRRRRGSAHDGAESPR